MSKDSHIEWTDHTFNIVHGCTKVSEACQFCYAELWDRRQLYSDELHWGPNASRLKMSEEYWKQPLSWNRAAARQGRCTKVFCSSMADVFEDHADVRAEQPKLWKLIEQTPNLIWQLLTKRPENVMAMVPESWRAGFPPNVWMMTSTENQQRFNERVGHLKKVPAIVLGFSCEPLLSTIEIGDAVHGVDPKKLWFIAGGESSKSPEKCRLSRHEWFAALRDQCQLRGIAYFFKQWGNRHEEGMFTKDKSYRLLDGREWNEFPDVGLRAAPIS